jgi:cell division protein FtsN
MARTSKRSKRSRRSGGGTLLGILIGLVVGLAIAVAAALYMTKASVPFVDKGRRPPAAPAADAPKGGELPDPNRPLQKGRPPASDAGTGATPADAAAPAPMPGTAPSGSAAGSPPGAMPGALPATTPGATPGAMPGASSTAPGAPPASSAEPAPDRTAYLLQAGAFKGQEDAEAMKARLALIGFEATVVTAEVNGVTFYRVRVGPYRQIDDMNRARSRLAENGIEASVVRQR